MSAIYQCPARVWGTPRDVESLGICRCPDVVYGNVRVER